eukprot:g3777.t1
MKIYVLFCMKTDNDYDHKKEYRYNTHAADLRIPGGMVSVAGCMEKYSRKPKERGFASLMLMLGKCCRWLSEAEQFGLPRTQWSGRPTVGVEMVAPGVDLMGGGRVCNIVSNALAASGNKACAALAPIEDTATPALLLKADRVDVTKKRHEYIGGLLNDRKRTPDTRNAPRRAECVARSLARRAVGGLARDERRHLSLIVLIYSQSHPSASRRFYHQHFAYLCLRVFIFVKLAAAAEFATGKDLSVLRRQRRRFRNRSNDERKDSVRISGLIQSIVLQIFADEPNLPQ